MYVRWPGLRCCLGRSRGSWVRRGRRLLGSRIWRRSGPRTASEDDAEALSGLLGCSAGGVGRRWRPARSGAGGGAPELPPGAVERPPGGAGRGPSWMIAGSRSAGRVSSLSVVSCAGMGAGEGDKVCIKNSSEDGTEAADGAAANGNTSSSKMTCREMIMRRVCISRQR